MRKCQWTNLGRVEKESIFTIIIRIHQIIRIRYLKSITICVAINRYKQRLLRWDRNIKKSGWNNGERTDGVGSRSYILR